MLLLNVMTCVSWTFSMNKQKLAKHIREALRLNIICVLSNGMAMQVYVGFCSDRETPGVSIRYISSDIFCNPIILFLTKLKESSTLHKYHQKETKKKSNPKKKLGTPNSPTPGWPWAMFHQAVCFSWAILFFVCVWPLDFWNIPDTGGQTNKIVNKWLTFLQWIMGDVL